MAIANFRSLAQKTWRAAKKTTWGWHPPPHVQALNGPGLNLMGLGRAGLGFCEPVANTDF